MTYFPPPCAKSTAFQNKLYQIKDLLEFVREKCSLLIHQCKHSTVVHSNEYTAVHVSFIGECGGCFAHLHYHLYGDPVPVRRLLNYYGECCPCPANVDFCGYCSELKLVFLLIYLKQQKSIVDTFICKKSFLIQLCVSGRMIQ